MEIETNCLLGHKSINFIYAHFFKMRVTAPCDLVSHFKKIINLNKIPFFSAVSANHRKSRTVRIQQR